VLCFAAAVVVGRRRAEGAGFIMSLRRRRRRRGAAGLVRAANRERALPGSLRFFLDRDGPRDPEPSKLAEPAGTCAAGNGLCGFTACLSSRLAVVVVVVVVVHLIRSPGLESFAEAFGVGFRGNGS
jgi:hypothetical protein